tara:strand:+ start:72 stop:791 length:720 start_codon:yes stop_codon:yes gene_type:complete
MNLAIDIGNTNSKIAVFDKNNMILYKSFLKISKDTIDSVFAKYSIVSACISNNGSKSSFLLEWLKAKKIKIFTVSSNLQLPLEIKYKTPKTLGSDRIALAVGSMQYEGQKLIIDLGTCITYDLVIGRKHLGGQISMGVNMRLKALSTQTSALPNLDFEIPCSFIGETTRESMLIGVYESIFFELQSVIDKYKVRYPSIITILTGNDSKFFEKRLKNISFINPFLLMEGLNHIIAFNENV